MVVQAYGTWKAAIDAGTVARAPSPRFGALDVRGGAVRFTESRASEGGRTTVVEWRDGALSDLIPSGFNARTRVHEYGGGAVFYHGDVVFFSAFAGGQLYRLERPGADPIAITPEPPEPNSLRYADGTVSPDGHTIVCVRERHEGGGVTNELVAFPCNGSAAPRVVASGHDFFAAPRFDPSGKRLSWLSWDHPRMPWDGTELWLADVAPEGALSGAQRVTGGPEESIIEPRWSPDGVLHFGSDRDGFWNLYRLDSDDCERSLTALVGGEVGSPAWVFDTRRYAFLGDGRIACVVTRAATDSLELLDPQSGKLEPTGLRYTSYAPTALAAGGGQIAFAAASPTDPPAIVLFDPDSGREQRVRSTFDAPDATSVSVPRAIEFSTRDGAVAHAFFYPPRNAAFEGPADERPPLRVICHGGPTGHTSPRFSPEVQYYTERGIGVVDVNYRGSSGYGRAYRRLLDGRWGEIDWQDCVSAAEHLAAEGLADPARTWVEGGSAGGYVVLCALVFDPTAFAAGVSLFGVADAEALARDTHKFESRYLDTMIGPYPARADLYRERSPVHFADRLERPLLLLQGLDDKVVPPSQAEMMVEVLDEKRIPHAYLAFEGEGHGFRKEQNIRRTLEATLVFIGRVFGFSPAGELAPLEIAHLEG
jgi:dipeptidyl aminopeptidase/acylaminoacyl peptidase